jgi:DNA-binding NtrC family response regulator
MVPRSIDCYDWGVPGRTVNIPMPRFLPVRTLLVEVLDGPDKGMSLEAQSESVTVGTATGNDLSLNDESVSRFHLELKGRDDGVEVIDCGSTNGTLAGNIRVARAVVPAGSLLELGRTKLRVGGGKRALVELHTVDSFGALRGRTPAMRRMFARLTKLAASDVGLLLVGESGTGKELIAEAVHRSGARAEMPFITVDGGALAHDLVASELFGHERGAFTGANERHIGAFERANGGTLFLDEIGELPAALQSTLLGVLERRRFRRVGGREEISVDVRVLAATNRDLRAEVNAGRFRLDLYYRLAVMTVEVPALRERADDIELLVEHFLELAGHQGAMEEVISQEMLDQLATHHWPGNVRELRNVVEASLAMGEAVQPPGADMGEPPLLDADAVRLSLDAPYNEARAELLHEFEKRYLAKLLERSEGNVSRASREARMNRSHLFSLLRRHNLR